MGRALEGMIVGAKEGNVLGINVGVKLVGKVEGIVLGRCVKGNLVGLKVGEFVGNTVGTNEGLMLG